MFNYLISRVGDSILIREIYLLLLMGTAVIVAAITIRGMIVWMGILGLAMAFTQLLMECSELELPESSAVNLHSPSISSLNVRRKLPSGG